MQKQEIEQIIYQKAQQLPIEALAEVLQFVEFVQFKNSKKPESSLWQQDFLSVSQWDSDDDNTEVKSWQIEEF